MFKKGQIFLSEVTIEPRYDANCEDNLKSIGTF